MSRLVSPPSYQETGWLPLIVVHAFPLLKWLLPVTLMKEISLVTDLRSRSTPISPFFWSLCCWVLVAVWEPGRDIKPALS